MPSKPVEGVVFGRLFTFLPPTRASQFSEQTAIDDRPKPTPSPLNYPAYYLVPTYVKNISVPTHLEVFLTPNYVL